MVKNYFSVRKTAMIGLSLISLSNFSLANDLGVQTQLIGSNGLTRDLPTDGSSCDPRVIAKNLKRVNSLNVLVVKNLTTTTPAHGNCYGSCPSDLQKALVEHCAKASKLEAIANLLD